MILSYIHYFWLLFQIKGRCQTDYIRYTTALLLIIMITCQVLPYLKHL